MIKILKILSFIFLFPFVGFVQISEYNYKRELIGVEDEWHRMEIPNAVFEKISSSFNNFRIFGISTDNDTVEAPYLINVLKEKVSREEVEFKLINQSKNADGHFYTFQLPKEMDINEMDLDFGRDNYDWKINIDASHDQLKWFTIVENYRILSIINQHTRYSYKNVSFSDSRYTFYRLHIPTASDPELIIPKLSMNSTKGGKIRKYSLVSQNTIQNKKEKTTVTILELKEAVPISHVLILFADKFDFYRHISIEYLVDSVKTEKGYLEQYMDISGGIVSSLEKNEFTLPEIITKKLRITIRNDDNQPLTIKNIEVDGYVYEVVARFTTPAAYFFVYGTKNESYPNYDIEHFKELIPTDLKTLSFGEEFLIKSEDKEEVEEAFFKSKFWLWGIMGVIIFLLGWFSFKMLRSEGENS